MRLRHEWWLRKRESLLQALTVDPERILALHAVDILGNSMPDDRIMSRRQRRGEGHDELLLILWIIHRDASGNCFPSLILRSRPENFAITPSLKFSLIS